MLIFNCMSAMQSSIKSDTDRVMLWNFMKLTHSAIFINHHSFAVSLSSSVEWNLNFNEFSEAKVQMHSHFKTFFFIFYLFAVWRLCNCKSKLRLRIVLWRINFFFVALSDVELLGSHMWKKKLFFCAFIHHSAMIISFSSLSM